MLEIGNNPREHFLPIPNLLLLSSSYSPHSRSSPLTVKFLEFCHRKNIQRMSKSICPIDYNPISISKSNSPILLITRNTQSAIPSLVEDNQADLIFISYVMAALVIPCPGIQELKFYIRIRNLPSTKVRLNR